MSDTDLQEFYEARETVVDRYESGKWDRDAAEEALRYVHRKYVIGVDEEHLSRGLRDYRDVGYCPFCGSDSVVFIGWLPQDQGPEERLFQCDRCGGFDIAGKITGQKKATPDVLSRLEEPLDE